MIWNKYSSDNDYSFIRYQIIIIYWSDNDYIYLTDNDFVMKYLFVKEQF